MKSKSQIMKEYAKKNGLPIIEFKPPKDHPDIYDVSPFEIKHRKIRMSPSSRDLGRYRAIRNATLREVCKRLTLRKLDALVNIAKSLAEV